MRAVTVWARAGLALVVLTGLAACEAEGAAPSPSPSPVASPAAAPSPSPTGQPGTFLYGMREPSSLLPADAGATEELVVVDTLFDSLTTYGEDGVEQSAAISWLPDENGRVWTYRLRPGATFATPLRDPVTADDFIFAWNLAVAEGRRAAFHLEDVEGYQAVRDGATQAMSGLSAPESHTLVVTLSKPHADFPSVTAHPALGPLPRAHYQADPGAFAQRPAGNGPFTAADWERGKFLRVTRFNGWRNGRGQAPLAEVVFRFSDAETAYVAFQQERRDYAPLPAGALADAREEYGEGEDGYSGPGVLDGPAGQLYFLGVNHTVPPFDRVEVRRALSLALDRTALAEAVREGNADPAFGAVPIALPDARARPCSACRHDPETARRLFREADVSQLELWFNQDGGHEQIAELVSDQLAEVGVTLRVRTPPESEPGTSSFAPYLDRLRSGEAALFRFGWAVEYPTLDDALTPLFSAQLAGVDGAANYGQYSAPDVSALLAEARATLDPDERRALYRQAEDLALDRDQAIIPLLTFRHAAVVSDRFEGFAVSPLGLPNMAEVAPATARQEVE